MQQDHRDSLELWGQQALRVQQAAQDLWDQSVRLALAAQMAWLDLWVLPVLQGIRTSRTGRRSRQGRRDWSEGGSRRRWRGRASGCCRSEG